MPYKYFSQNRLGKYKLITVATALACIAINSAAYAQDIEVSTSTELRNALNKATAADTIIFKNDIDMTSGAYSIDLTGKNISIDGKGFGIASLRNLALLVKQKGTLTIKNIGKVDNDYNVISSFNNNQDKQGGWGGPITTQNRSGAVTYDENSKLTISDSVFTNNYAGTDGGAIGLQSLDFDIQNSVFINNSSGQEGGAIWAEVNKGNIENCYFKGNFVRDQKKNTSIGGAIANYSYYADRPAYLDKVSGTFIENYSYNIGGAIVNRQSKADATINNISGTFNSNYSIQAGGAIVNAAGTINSIDGTFTKNYLLNTNTSTDGVSGATLLKSNESLGGAIANTNTGGGNEATTVSHIQSITGEFIGNFINTKNGKAYGGAIYNAGIIDEISGTFKDNYVYTEGTADNLAFGGAIYSTKDLTITSGKNGTLFSGNYTAANTQERNYNAIYMGSADATLNLIPKSGKTIQFDDNIDGVPGYNVNIKSENGGTLKLYNDINNANITTGNVNIDFADTKFHDYNFLSLNSSADTNYIIDVQLTKQDEQPVIVSDTIKVGSSSSGVITLSDMNFIADKDVDYTGKTFTKQIISGSDNLELALGTKLQQSQQKVISTAVNDVIKPTTNSSDVYYKRIYTGQLSSQIALTTTSVTSTKPDTISVTVSGLTWNEDVQKEVLGDTFALWLGLETADDKEFQIAANQQYKVSEVLNPVPAGKLSIVGASNVSSVLDADNKALFYLDKDSDLTLQNVRIISAKSDSGSVIKAVNQASAITIDNGSFINNVAALFGGVVSNASTKLTNNIKGIFTGNTAGSSGGAIFNQGNINSISGEFNANHTTNSWATGKVVGGAIANKGGTITNINADFTSNYSDQYGGAIANFVESGVSSTINSITGNFNDNYIVVNNAEAFGGAIYNNGTISTISGNFKGNHIAQDNSDTIKAYGGAIYNWGSNDLKISGQFTDNYISVNSNSTAFGGAIYTKMNTSIVADNGQNTLFKGNYVQVGNTKNDNAIYVDNIYATLTLNATTGGVISLYDNIDGAVSKATDENTGNETITGCYKVQMIGDNTGVIGLYNDINNAMVTVGNNITISLADGNTRDYTFYDLNSSDTSKWNIDVDLTNEKADTITTLSDTSTGTIMINNFNIIGSTSKDSLTIQILKNTSGNNNLKLAINPNSLVADVRNIGNEVFSSKSYLKQDGGIALATTQTENDSIKILQDGLYDALKLINDKDTSDERKFTFDTAGTHSLIENLGVTKSGALSINGYSNDSNVSVVDLAGKTGFELTNGGTTININNATLTDSSSTSNPLITVKSEGNTINLDNAQLNGNIKSDLNTYNLNLSGNKVNILGTVDNANAKLDDALTTLTFNTDTFSNATLSAENGIINLQNSAIERYNIGTLISAADTLYNIDVDAYNKTADKITAGASSDGTVTINSINFLNGIKPQDKTFSVQILDTTSSTLKLALSNEITSQLYDFETITEIDSKDTITPTVNFDEKFYQSDKEYLIKGHLSVLDDYKSIGFKDDEFQKVLISVSNKKLLNSLSELCSLNATGKKFTFNNATEDNKVYGVISDIGTVVNDLTIEGKAFSDTDFDLSVIGIDNNKGFELTAGSELTLSRVTLNGSVSNPVIINNGGTVEFSKSNIINGLITGNETGRVTNSGKLYISASNLGVDIVNNHYLYLSDGVLNSEITGQVNEYTYIVGDVTNNAKIAQKVNVNGNASLTVGADIGDLGNSGRVTANVENLTGDISNAGTLTLSGTLDSNKTGYVGNAVGGTILFSGTLDRTIADGGETKVNNTLTLGTNAGIEGTLNLNNGTINTKDGTLNAYNNINQITGSGSATIDIDWVNQTSDTFNCTTSGGGIISLIVDTSSVFASNQIEKITNGNVGIAIGNTEPDVKTKTETGGTNLTASVNWTDKFGAWSKTDTYTGTLTAYKSSDTLTVNDSIKYEVSKEEGAVIYNPDKDTLALITTSQIADNPDKSFKTNDASAIYTVKENLGTLNDNLTISGTINEENAKISTINVGEYAGITIAGNNSLTVKDVKVTSNGTFIDATSNLAKITLDNAQILADISSAGDLDITNQTEVTNLTASGNTTVDSSANLTVSILNNSGTFENNGSLYAADKIINSGTITTDADNIIADNGIVNNSNLILNNGVLSSHVAGSGTTEILGAVTNNATISQTVNVKENASLNVGANIGNLINEGDVSANANYLTGTVNNSGTIALSGTLDKKITGNGTTIISGNELTLSDGAAIEGTLNINNATLNLLSKNTANIFNNVSINSGTLNLINDSINNLSASSFNLTGDINLLLDADLSNSSMDRLPASTTVSNGMINIQGINLISDSKELKTYIPFAYDGFKANVKTDITEIGSGVNNRYQTTTYAPIYKYDVSYNPESGSFLFARGGGGSSGDFNPAVLPSSVNSQAGAYTAMNETFNYAFRHADYSFMPLPKRIRSAMTNRYAINALQSLPFESEYSKSAGIWYQPYVNFENMHLSNGPRVDIQSYGSLVGADSEFKQLKHGWGTVTTPYIGYNGSSQHYAGVSTYTNGGILGLTQTFYKNNFFTAITVNAGANVGEANTMYGHENFTTLMAGVASKTGYNFEFNDGKFIIQPNYMMSYSFINTFDYTNAAGVRIDSDPLHTIQIHPTIKFIGNLKNGWQPYASVGMVWNLLNETKVTANNAALPEMSIKPYVEYGLGIQKTYKDKFTGFAQAMVRNGGRNGIALSFGFKWAIGKEPKPVEKVQAPVKNGLPQTCNNIQAPKKVVIKQLNRG
ncbi:MAG: hypothetical protein ACI37Q_06470 [Candidatus Gastranaerophilaceae bacterium]